MQLPLNKEEKEMFRAFAGSHTGTVLLGFINRMIREVESVRNKSNLSNEARIEVADCLDENFVRRIGAIKRGSGTDEPQRDEYDVYDDDPVIP